MEGVELLEGEVFKQIIGYENYYISNKGRCYNVKTKRFIGHDNGYGYIIVQLYNDDNEQQNFLIHQLVMQFFGPPMPEGNYEIDHLNHIRDDNRIENICWKTKSQNNKNRTSNKGVEYEYFDEIPVDDVDDIIWVRDYGNHEFEDLYFADGFFYFDTGISYRRLHINFDKTGSAFVNVYNTNNKKTSIAYTKFKRLYGLN